MHRPDYPLDSSFTPTEESFEVRHGLVRGKQYRVIESFVDADGDLHQPGENWKLLAAGFNKFDDEVIFDISRREVVMRIPLRWKADAQANVIENLADYIA